MERTRLATAFRHAAPLVWELIGSHAQRIPTHTREFIDRAIDQLFDVLAGQLTAGEIEDDALSALAEYGFSLSRMLSWDLINEINLAYVQTAVESVVALDVAEPGHAARCAVAVSDAFYNGFWVFNNHEGLGQALRLGALIEHFPAPTFMLDEFGAITFANVALCRTLGQSAGELDGRKLADLVMSEQTILDSAESEVTLPGNDGATRHLRLTVARIKNPEGVEYFGQLIDRTDDVRLERTKEQVIATISHELRTPLTAVVGYAQLLHEAQNAGHTDEGVDEAEAVDVIFEQASHLLDLVSDLVDFARLDTGRIGMQPAEVDLRSALDRVLRRVRFSDQAEINLRVPHRTLLFVDRTRVEQLFTNLLTNAARYGGPSVLIEAWRPSPARVAVRVADDGPGIPVADRERIFETFYQGGQTHVGIGTGMGLAICRAIARAHQGSIHLENGPGASFVVELPSAI